MNFGDEIHKREKTMQIRNEKRHQEAINYLLEILKENNLDIPDESLKEYLQKYYDAYGEPDETNLDENEQTHRDVISYLMNLLQTENIDISDDNLKTYLTKIGDYDCMWEDYRKE